MTEQEKATEDEINLTEIFAVLWAHKLLLIFALICSILFSGYYSLTLDRKFTATAIFQIKHGDRDQFNLSSEVGALASIAGLGNIGQSDSQALLERIAAREFIRSMIKKLELASDPSFNTYNPNRVDPFWKTKIKNILGWKLIKSDPNALIENTIIANYKSSVSARDTASGAISISVTHKNPTNASLYANSLMREIQQLVEIENVEAQNLRLTYLSETLADSLQDMEKAQQKLKDFALKNSALAEENFISGSLKLDELRMESIKVQEISDVLNVLSKLVEHENLDNSSYYDLRINYPLVDDVDFRRILGMSETISAWSWPSINTINAVKATLKDRFKRLEVEINNIEENAKIYATSAGDLAKLTREAKVAEATYTVLIEQVKSQSLAAGFQPDTFKVFEYATPPVSPSSPDRKIILAMGAAFGIFLGCSLALINSIWRGTYYTKASLVLDTKPSLVLYARPFRKLTYWSVSKVSEYLLTRRILEVDEAEIKISNKKLVYIVNNGGRLKASGTARLLAMQSSRSGRKVVLCDKTGDSEKGLEEKSLENIPDMTGATLDGKLDLVTGDNGASFFTSSNFKSNIEKLMLVYDQVFVCSKEYDSILGLMALKDFNPCVVLLSRLRKTKKIDIKRITQNCPIDVLLYD